MTRNIYCTSAEVCQELFIHVFIQDGSNLLDRLKGTRSFLCFLEPAYECL